jgi:hypothetical protein
LARLFAKESLPLLQSVPLLLKLQALEELSMAITKSPVTELVPVAGALQFFTPMESVAYVFPAFFSTVRVSGIAVPPVLPGRQ